MHIRSAVVVAGVALVVLVAAQVQGMDVTTCGQVVPKGDAGRLVVDLSCSPDGAFTFDAAVTLEAGAALDLAGHRIEMGHDSFEVAGVDCKGRCAVTSSSAPGEIIGIGPIANSSGIRVGGAGRGRITNVHIEGFTAGVRGSGSLNLTGVTVASNENYGAFAEKSIKATDVVATGNELALTAAKSVTARRTTATGNRTGLHSPLRVRGIEVQVNDNITAGIDCWDGASRGSVALRDSTVTGNGIYDLTSGRLPRLVRSTCGTSHQAGTSETWGVCTND